MRYGFETVMGVDEGTCKDVFEEDGESMPWTERIEDDEGACCGDGRIGGRCGGIG